MLLPSRPLLPVALALCAGILIGGSWWAVALPLILAVAIFAASFHSPLRRYQALPGIALLFGFVGFGGMRQFAAQTVPPSDIANYIPSGIVTVHGSVAGDVTVHPRTLSVEMNVESVQLRNGVVHSCTGRLSCMLVRDARTALPDYGDAIEARGMLERPLPLTNSGGFDAAAYYARRSIFATLYARNSFAWKSDSNTSQVTLLRLTGKAKRSIINTFTGLLPQAEAGLLSGIVIGSRADLPRSLDDDFQVTGTSHILATAGLHIGLVALILNGFLRACRVSRRSSAVITMVVLLLYAIIAGGRPSVMRAILVADIFLAGYLLDREPDAANSLAVAAIVLLAYNPGNLFEAGFQLSFATVASIIGIMSVLRPQHTAHTLARNDFGTRTALKLKAWFIELSMLTFAAQVGSAPLVAQYFYVISPSGLIANLLIIPALLFALGLGPILWVVSAIGIPYIPNLLATLLHYLLLYVIGAAQTCAGLPFASIAVPPPGWMFISAYYSAMAFAVWHFQKRRARPRSYTIPDDAKSNEAAELVASK